MIRKIVVVASLTVTLSVAALAFVLESKQPLAAVGGPPAHETTGLISTGGPSASPLIGIKLVFEFGKRREDGTCGPGFGVCRLSITVGSVAKTGFAECLATLKNNQELECEFRNELPTSDRTLPVEDDIVLEDELARRLGFKKVTVLKGNYAIDRSKGQFGAVTLRVRIDGGPVS